MKPLTNSKQRLMDAARHLIWRSSYGTTTVDAICEKAEVKKGSFYYFFKSKSDLAVTALRSDWENNRGFFEKLFSGPPLERFQKFYTFVFEGQSGIKTRHGRVLGCPLFSLGCEVSTIDAEIGAVVKDILNQYLAHMEKAIREAQEQGLVAVSDPGAKARCVFSYFEGALTQARIENNVEPLKALYPTTLEIIGAHTAQAA